MVTVNKTMNEDIKEFGVFSISNGRLVPNKLIKSIQDYNHYGWHLHHFIKAQDYKRNRKWYEENNIIEKLIFMACKMHTHLEDPIYGLSDEEFYKVYHIQKNVLLFNKKKWIEKQVREEMK